MGSDPMTYDGLIKQAEAHYNAHEYQQAVACATQAIELDRNAPESYYWRGNAYNETGDFDRAIADYAGPSRSIRTMLMPLTTEESHAGAKRSMTVR